MAAVAVANLAACRGSERRTGARRQVCRRRRRHRFPDRFRLAVRTGLAKLYKIVAFLTWLECYGPVLGKGARHPAFKTSSRKAPRAGGSSAFLCLRLVRDRSVADRKRLGFRIGAAGMALATCAIVVELIKTRRLVRVPHGSSPIAAPHLLYASASNTMKQENRNDDILRRRRCETGVESRRRAVQHDHGCAGVARTGPGAAPVRHVQAVSAVRRHGTQRLHTKPSNSTAASGRSLFRPVASHQRASPSDASRETTRPGRAPSSNLTIGTSIRRSRWRGSSRRSSP